MGPVAPQLMEYIMMREELNFVNHIGQEIEPGDKVIVITHCTGSTKTYQGVYLGLYGPRGRVQARVQTDTYMWVNKLTGEPQRYDLIPADARSYQKAKVDRITTLQKNLIYKIA